MDPMSIEQLVQLLQRNGKTAEEAREIVDLVNRDGDAQIKVAELTGYNLLRDLNGMDRDGNRTIDLEELRSDIVRFAQEEGRSLSNIEVEAGMQGGYPEMIQGSICEHIRSEDVHPSLKEELGQFFIQTLPGKPSEECGPLIS